MTLISSKQAEYLFSLLQKKCMFSIVRDVDLSHLSAWIDQLSLTAASDLISLLKMINTPWLHEYPRTRLREVVVYLMLANKIETFVDDTYTTQIIINISNEQREECYKDMIAQQ